MKTEALINDIRSKFEATVDAALLFRIDTNAYNTEFTFEDDVVSTYRDFNGKIIETTRNNKFDNNSISKDDVYRYLTLKFIEWEKTSWRKTEYGQDSFYDKFWPYWLERLNKVENTLAIVAKYLSIEEISEDDIVVANVIPDIQYSHIDYYNIDVKIFLITQKYLAEIYCNTKGLVHRIEHKIQRDIKRIVATSKSLEVYFHGIHKPFSIALESYEEVISLQRKLLELKDQNHFQNRRPR